MKIRHKQRGIALMLAAFILALAATAYALRVMSLANIEAAQNEKTMQSLNAAKQALIAWAVSHPNHPGQMPFPDRGLGGGYDGNSDCYTGAFNYSFLIGQLPSIGQTPPCALPRTGLGEDFRDAQGNKLWYAVSRNLVHEYQAPSFDPIINPSLIGKTTDWIHIVDRNGNLIADRVAAVIIAPGEPVGNQDRSAAVPTPDNYLDKIVRVSDNKPFKNYGYPINPFDDNEFIIGDDSRNVGFDDNTFQKPYYFNDKLVYITIDELISALERRAAMEAKSLLTSYKAKNGFFPDADLLGANSNTSLPGNKEGRLPIDITDSCSCSASNSCTCSFDLITSVAFKRASGTWSAANISGACARTTSTVCTCTGAGFCENTAGTSNFTCTAAGLCTHNVTGTYTYAPPAYADIYTASNLALPGCKLSSGNAVCNEAGSFTIGLKESTWFKDNLWQDYFYYQWAPGSNLQAGNKTGISALLIATGQPIFTPPYATKFIPTAPYVASTGPQNRPPTNPSPSLSDYLDSAESTDGDLRFEATNKQKTNNYNDQTFIVAP